MKEDRVECYICERSIFTYESDHFPVPRSLGGVVTLPICRDCHDAKDRHPLGAWDPSVAFAGLRGLWGKANRDERLILAKIFHVASQHAAFEAGK